MSWQTTEEEQQLVPALPTAWIDALDNLKDAVDRLNAAADDAVAQIKLAEQLIGRTNPAITGYIKLDKDIDIGWDRVGGEWHICCRRFPTKDKPEPVTSTPRLIRIRATHVLAELINTLADETRGLVVHATKT